jgi:hypothetical protein
MFVFYLAAINRLKHENVVLETAFSSSKIEKDE